MAHSPVQRGEHAVLLVLAERANRKTGVAWPSVTLIAHESKLKRRWAQECLKRLQGRGLIEARGRTAYGVTKYELKFKAEALTAQGGCIPMHGGVHSDAQGGAVLCTLTGIEPETEPEVNQGGSAPCLHQEVSDLGTANDIAVGFKDNPDSAKDGKRESVNKTLLMDFQYLWNTLSTECGHYEFAPLWVAKREGAYIGQFIKSCPKGRSKDVFRGVMEDWWGYCLHVGNAQGLTKKILPTKPQVKFMARYGAEAVDYILSNGFEPKATTETKAITKGQQHKNAVDDYLAMLEKMTGGKEG